MPHAVTPAFDIIASISWLDLIKTLASVATAFIAFLALRNWQRQDKAKREAEFLDELIEAAHTYIVAMHRPISLLEYAKIGMASHVRNWEDGEETEKVMRGAIAYVEKWGERDGRRLSAVLEEVAPAATKLRSLVAKGQVFKFEGYTKCQNAIELLTWHLGRISSFAAVTESPTWNWEHPHVRRVLANVMAIEPSEIQKSIGENNVAVIEFACETYERLYAVSVWKVILRGCRKAMVARSA